VRALERIMTVDPKTASRRAAGPLLRGRANHRKLREVLEVLLASETEPEARFDLLVRLARLTRDLRDTAAAFGYYAEGRADAARHRTEILDEVEEVTEGGRPRWRDLEATTGRPWPRPPVRTRPR